MKWRDNSTYNITLSNVNKAYLKPQRYLNHPLNYTVREFRGMYFSLNACKGTEAAGVGRQVQ